MPLFKFVIIIVILIVIALIFYYQVYNSTLVNKDNLVYLKFIDAYNRGISLNKSYDSQSFITYIDGIEKSAEAGNQSAIDLYSKIFITATYIRSVLRIIAFEQSKNSTTRLLNNIIESLKGVDNEILKSMIPASTIPDINFLAFYAYYVYKMKNGKTFNIDSVIQDGSNLFVYINMTDNDTNYQSIQKDDTFTISDCSMAELNGTYTALEENVLPGDFTYKHTAIFQGKDKLVSILDQSKAISGKLTLQTTYETQFKNITTISVNQAKSSVVFKGVLSSYFLPYADSSADNLSNILSLSFVIVLIYLCYNLLL